MVFISNLREDIRFARATKQKLRPLFWFVDFLKLAASAAMVGAFVFGIWWILYGFPFPDSLPDKIESLSQRTQSGVTEQRSVVSAQAADSTQIPRESSSSSALSTLQLPAEDNSVKGGQVKRQQESRAELIDSEVKVYQVQTVSLPKPLRARDSSTAATRRSDSRPSTSFPETVPIMGIESLKSVPDAADIAGANSDSSPQVQSDEGISATFVAPNKVSPEWSAATEAPKVTIIVADSPGFAVKPESAANDLLGDEWLLALAADSYLIQLSSTQNKPFLIRFAKSLPNGMNRGLYSYRKNRLGNQVYVLYAGDFDSSAEATAALLALSPEIKRFGAFVRATRFVQEEIKQFRLTLSSTTTDQ